MTLVVRRFEDRDGAGIERLNRRFEAGDIEHRLYPEDLSQNPEADLAIHPVNHALYVAADGDEIRGGAWLLEQHFWVDGSRHRVGWMKYPVSESLVDKVHAGVPASMILQLLRKQPNLMVIGMGGHDAPFARLLRGIGWATSTIPMFFRIVRPFRVLRGLSYARRSRWRRWAMDLAAWSGMGALAHGVHLLARSRPLDSSIDVLTEHTFAPWADDIWERTRSSYSALAVRDSKVLDYLYDADVPGLHRLRVRRNGSDIGWVCAQMLSPDEGIGDYFGSLNVGVLTDVLAAPEDASVLLAAGTERLEELGADLVLVYLTHSAWTTAARRLRFLPGPSTFAFYRSPDAEKLIVRGDLAHRCHMTRSDGDGPRR